jgi:hypothetical protein
MRTNPLVTALMLTLGYLILIVVVLIAWGF